MPRKLALQLTEEQDYLAKYIAVTNQPFASVASNAKLKGIDQLVFSSPTSKEYIYARASRYRCYVRSLDKYQRGKYNTAWEPIERKESDPRDIFQSTHGIRELTEKELIAQSTFGYSIEETFVEDVTPVAKKKTAMSSRTPPKNRGRSRTPNATR